ERGGSGVKTDRVGFPLVAMAWRAAKLLAWKLAIALVFFAAATAVYLYYRGAEELRAHAERLLSARLPHLDVKVGRAQWIQGEGIRLRDVSVGLPVAVRRGDAPRRELVFVDEAILRCHAGPQELLSAQLAIE